MTGPVDPMEEQLVVLADPCQDKYERLLEAHEKLQKLNQRLEEKLLKLAEERQAETTQLSNQIQDLTQRLVEARLYIHQLEDENERYRNDINVAVQLLQCKPSNFISPKIDTLPEDLQRKVLGQRNGLGSGRKEKKIIKVQVPTFPPTDIMYAVDKVSKGKQQRNGEKDIVSAAIMAKVLEERENERKENQKNRCLCASRIVLPTLHKETQTLPTCTISYSDFPYSDETTTTITSTTNNNNDESQDVPMLKHNGNYQDYPAYTTYKHGLVRETSFCHHQSSSSLSSPTSSSASSSTHHHHHPSSTSSSHNNMLQDGIQSNASSPGPVVSQPNSTATPSNLGGGGSSNRRVDADHAMRQLDDKDSDDLLDGASSCSSTGTYSGNSHLRNGDGYPRNSSSNYSISSCGGNSSSYGLVNWRTTVVVQPPPKSHSTQDSLSLLMSAQPPPTPTQPMSTSSTTSPSSHNSPSNNVDLLDSEDSLGLCSSASSISSQLPMALLPQLAHLPHGHNQTLQSSGAQTSSFNSYHGMVVNSAPNSYPSPQLTHQPHQYYRAQKRTFWTRSSSTTSTETEI